MVIRRIIQHSIENRLFKGKVVIIYGARQVGKTTLIREIEKKYPNESMYVNCDEPDVRELLTDATSTELKTFIGQKRLIFIDEAQRVKNIGITLKLLADTLSNIQVVATGSSSFDLSNEIIEPLTGRTYEFYLYPFSFEELTQIHSPQELQRLLGWRLVYGMYPEVVMKGDEAGEIVKTIAKNYLFKDVLQFQRLKNPEILEKLLQALALQIGREVSYPELANTVGVDQKTVAHYLHILEKAFVIFRLNPYSRNLRKELGKLRKVYFVDTGIRNAIINNLNPLHLRQDIGELWENFLISERRKKNNNQSRDVNSYFWRTYQQQEIDYLEVQGGSIIGFEFKWRPKGFRPPKSFIEAYPKSDVTLIHKDNFQSFVS